RLLRSALLFLVIFPIAAHTAEIRVLSPGGVFNAGLLDLASDYTKKTGIKVLVLPDLMGKMANDLKERTPPPAVVMLPMDLMSTAALNGDIDAKTFTPLGRVEIGLAVKAGA